MRVKFQIADLKPLVDHAAASPQFFMAYAGGKPRPGLMLVKDQGLYFMSNGCPHLMADGTIATEEDQKGKRFVVYADGYGESVHIPGDDYAEFFDLQVFQDMIAQGHVTMTAAITEGSIAIFSEKTMTKEDARKQVLDWLATPDRLTVLQSARHNTFVTVAATARPVIPRKWPQAIILNDLPFEKAVEIYCAKRGIAA